MTGITIQQTVLEVVVAPRTGPRLTLAVPAAPKVVVQPVGMQGPAGPAADLVQLTATSALSALRVVSRTAEGVALCDPAAVTSLACAVGVTTTAASHGGLIMVRQSGVMSDLAWSWTPGQPLFCGVSGVLTGTPPTAVASRQIAVAIDPTSILIQPLDLIVME